MDDHFDCDLFVIGGGSGGVRAARMAAQRCARVVLAEAAALGGTCVNVGCIPKKLYSYAAEFASDVADAVGFGWDLGTPTLDWSRLKTRRAAEIARLNGVYEHLLRTAGVRIERGWAQVTGRHAVRVQSQDGQREFRARHILVATGGTPRLPEVPGRELLVSSDSMFDLNPFPKRLLIVGGGYIACEFASIFQGLGSRVTLLNRGEQVLRGFDDDVRHFVAHEMRKHGVDLRLHAELKSVQRQGRGLLATLANGDAITVDTILAATGRVPNTLGLGLESAGVALDALGAVPIDEHYQTAVPSIHAIGDVTARIQLTPVALAEAMALVDRLFGNGRRQVGYDMVPTAVFTHPNIATVGLTEAQAREQHGEVAVFRTDFKPLKHTLSGSTERTLMKLVVDCATDRVLGLHMVGAHAGEIVQGFAVAMRAGATKAVFDATIGIHPTAAEEFVTMREPIARSGSQGVASPLPTDAS